MRKPLDYETLDAYVRHTALEFSGASKAELDYISRFLNSRSYPEVIQISTWMAEQLDVDLDMDSALQLAAANACGWLAYGIHDQIVDAPEFEGGGHSELLPFASLRMRQAYRLFSDVETTMRHQAPTLTEDYFSRVDRGLARELREFRIDPNARLSMSDLPRWHWLNAASKSIGHALGPMIVARSAGLPAYVGRSTHRFFEHYLSARQLSDDLDDWRDDLVAGALTPVGLCVLAYAIGRSTGGVVRIPELLAADDLEFSEPLDAAAEMIRQLADRALFYLRKRGRSLPLEALVENIRPPQ